MPLYTQMWTNEKNKQQRKRMFHSDGNKEKI